MKFLVDRPLKGLVKWLRLCGLDAGLAGFSPRGAGLPAPEAGTFLLTRQAAFGRLKRDDLLILTANDPEDQLVEVLRRLKISRKDLAPLSRCGECNDLLEAVPRETALGMVPDHVFHTQAAFFRCPRCGRLYWPGSHPARIAARLREVLAEAGDGGSARPPTRKGVCHGV
jgi:hypothetical protein|uniref:Mut7-C RNAse domain-containing protein n=1 Tax=Desulfobacca acetoxidans TaxID=60893 RepID=A0A7C3UZ56_9BACT